MERHKYEVKHTPGEAFHWQVINVTEGCVAVECPTELAAEAYCRHLNGEEGV